MVNLLLTGVSSVFKRITENLVKSIPGCGLPPGSLRLSLIVAVVVTLQLLVSMSISRAVIFLLLMTSGDVERNPGPETSGRPMFFCHHSNNVLMCHVWCFQMSFLVAHIDNYPIAYSALLFLLFQCKTCVQVCTIHATCKLHALANIFSIVTKVSGTKATVLMILLLQAMAAVQTSLLMKSGDVETNPGPGLYPGG